MGISINLQRVKNRARKGGHDVPEEDQRRRYPRSFLNLRKALDFANEAVLLDNSTSAGHTRIAIKREGQGIELFEPVPGWLSFLRG